MGPNPGRPPKALPGRAALSDAVRSQFKLLDGLLVQAEDRIRQLEETLVTVQDRTAALQQDHWRDRKELATLQRQSQDIPATLEEAQRLRAERLEIKQALLRVLSATKALGKDLRS